MERLLDRSREGFCLLEVDGRIHEANPALVKLLCHTQTELSNRTIFEFLDENSAEVVRRQLGGDQQTEEFASQQVKLQVPHGESVTCTLNLHSIRGANDVGIGYIALWNDTSELRQTKNALRVVQQECENARLHSDWEARRNEHRLREALLVARAGNWEMDAKGRVTFSDEAFDVLNLDRGTFDGTAAWFYKHVHPDDRARMRRETETAVKARKRYELVYRIIADDGEIKTVRDSAAVVRDEHGTFLGMTGTVQDVTVQTAIQSRLREATRLAAMGQLAGGVAHDFNNLLGIILGSAELLQEAKKFDAGLIDGICQASNRAADLTAQLLSFARKQSNEAKSFSVAEFVQGRMRLFSKSIPRQIETEFQASPDTWEAYADDDQLGDVLLNLVLNAVDAMGQSGKLRIECRNEAVSTEQTLGPSEPKPGQYVALLVTDNGKGMTPEVLERATSAYFSTKGSKGSGLGLSLANGYASQFGGRLTISSQQGAGTTVKLLLPRAPSLAT